MASEFEKQRIRMLKQFAALKFPAVVAPQGGDAMGLAVIRSLFDDDLVDGSILPDHTGGGIAAITVRGITGAGYRAL